MENQRYRTDLIEWRMRELGVTVDACAPVIGISTHTLSKARTGKNLTIDKLIAVAAGLGLHMKYLFDFKLPLSKAEIAVIENGHRARAARRP
jgi:hypothetical protein